jgi:O-antigen/teichoic acid export membrane protein
MSIIRRNIVANAAGSGWNLLISLAAVPFYIRFLGIEAYGLIGFFVSLTAIFSLLDLGLRATLNRSLAQLSLQPGKEQQMHDLLRTLEVIYWAIGLAIGVTVALLAPVIAHHWIEPKQLSTTTVARAVIMIGGVIACQWPLALYSGGMMGLQRQVTLSVVVSVMATIRSVGAVLILWLIAPTIEAFFTWHILMSLVETMLTRFLLWHALPTTHRSGTFGKRHLSGLWRFAAGMTGMSVTSVILTQLDKVILSSTLSLHDFGYYMLAWRVATAFYSLSGPVTTAFFPRFTQLAASGDQGELVRLYHRGCQMISAVLVPVAVVLAMFAEDFLFLWTHDRIIAAHSGPMLCLLALGTATNCLMSLPATLQYAHGWTRLANHANAVAMLMLTPMTYLISTNYGGQGAAWVWLVLNLGYVVFMLRIMHRRLLPGELRSWFVIDVGAPLAAVIAVTGIWKLIMGTPAGYGSMLLNLAAVSLCAAVAAAAAAPQVRGLFVHLLLYSRRRYGGS